MDSLKETGRYTVPEAIGARIQDLFAAGWCDDEETAAAIAETYQKHGYLCDTHTAVAVHVYNEYRRETGDTTPTVIASTANPYKFSASVLDALHGGAAAMDEFDKVEALERLTGCEVPPSAGGPARENAAIHRGLLPRGNAGGCLPPAGYPVKTPPAKPAASLRGQSCPGLKVEQAVSALLTA